MFYIFYCAIKFVTIHSFIDRLYLFLKLKTVLFTRNKEWTTVNPKTHKLRQKNLCQALKTFLSSNKILNASNHNLGKHHTKTHFRVNGNDS